MGRAVLPKAITRAVSKYDVRRRKEYEKTGVPKGALSPTLCDVIIETTVCVDDRTSMRMQRRAGIHPSIRPSIDTFIQGLPLEKGVFSWSALFTYMLALVNAAGTGR